MNGQQEPPQPLPESLWGDRWRFASIEAKDISEAFTERMIPFKSMPEELLPLNMAIASTAVVPGAIVYGGKQSIRLARWLSEQNPINITYVAAEAEMGGGLLLKCGYPSPTPPKADRRWIMATFSDREVVAAAAIYEARKQESRGLHFLIVQPDDSGMTYSGFWLLR
jgi:hypothetical protein